MKYYVACTLKFYDGNIGRSYTGGITKHTSSGNIRAEAYILNHEFKLNECANETEDEMVKRLFDNPFKSKNAAIRYFNKCGNTINTVADELYKVKEYPEEISYQQFKDFIKWGN